jgi:Bacteriophage Lambda NinG protein
MKCALAYARAHPAKIVKHLIRAAKVEKREARERLKSRRDRMKEAQRAFNAFCRERDYFLPCISCGVMSPPQFHGGAWDCGHYLSVGAHPELRFEELNAAKQCKPCNSGTRRGGRYVMPLERQESIRAAYREGLLKRIGPEAVEWLEGPHEPKHYTADDLIAIRKTYQAKLRELRQAREMGHGVAA